MTSLEGLSKKETETETEKGKGKKRKTTEWEKTDWGIVIPKFLASDRNVLNFIADNPTVSRSSLERNLKHVLGAETNMQSSFLSSNFVNTFGYDCLSEESGDAHYPGNQALPKTISSMFGPLYELISIETSGSGALQKMRDLAKIICLDKFKDGDKQGKILTFAGNYNVNSDAHSFQNMQPFLQKWFFTRRDPLSVQLDDFSITYDSHYIYGDFEYHWDPVIAIGASLTEHEITCLNIIQATIELYEESMTPICALIYESVTFTGLRSVRPVFLRKVHDVCKSKKIGFFEDAIMTSVRCGWLHLGEQHGIVPDALVFGKAWHVSGLLIAKNGFKWPCPIWHLAGSKTSHGLKVIFNVLLDRVAMFESPDFLSRIREIGTKIIAGIIERGGKARGLGCLIHFSGCSFGPNRHSFNRLLPLLNTTDSKIDLLLSTCIRC